MDPLAIATPNATGVIPLDNDNVRLHYELYTPSGTSSDSGSSGTCNKSPLLMLMGAFATKAHFAEMARFIADTSGHEVCIYDHRGVNRSGPPRLEAQTAAQLAADALVVADTLWGPGTPVHVYGASMGGMVAQELALLLIPQRRLLSLTLSITCRGMQPIYGLLGPILTPQVLERFFELWFWDSKPNLVRRLMRLLLTRQLMESLHPCGETYGQVYQKAWLDRFDELWTFNNHAAGANHAHVVLHQHLSDQQAAIIRDCGAPIACQVSTQDNLIPAAMQFELADMLRARTITIPTGHMGFLPWKDRYYSLLLEQLAMGEAVKGLQAARHARVSAAGGAAGVAAAGASSLMGVLAKMVAAAASASGGGRGGSSGSNAATTTAVFAAGSQAPSQALASPEPSLAIAGGFAAGAEHFADKGGQEEEEEQQQEEDEEEEEEEEQEEEAFVDGDCGSDLSIVLGDFEPLELDSKEAAAAATAAAAAERGALLPF